MTRTRGDDEDEDQGHEGAAADRARARRCQLDQDQDEDQDQDQGSGSPVGLRSTRARTRGRGSSTSGSRALTSAQLDRSRVHGASSSRGTTKGAPGRGARCLVVGGRVPISVSWVSVSALDLVKQAPRPPIY